MGFSYNFLKKVALEKKKLPCGKLDTIILVQLANPYNYRCNKERYIGVLLLYAIKGLSKTAYQNIYFKI